MLQTTVAPSTSPTPDGTPRESLRLTTTAPREYVHRAAVAEVFLTDEWSRHGEERFTLTAQWPRAHSFYAAVGGVHYDPLMAAETIRQVGAWLAHAGFDVPLGHQFLMWELNYSVRRERLTIGGAPADLRLDIVCTDVRRRGGRLAGLSYEVVVSADGHTVATGSARYTCTSPDVYRRVRAPQLAALAAADPEPPAPPVAPARVGRLSDFDVVLAPTGQPNRWQLRADTRHPVLFDHPGDHIPGMVLLEAARQAVHTMAPRGRTVLPVAMDSTFHRYAEFGSPCWIATEPAVGPGERGGLVLVTGRQGDDTVFTSVVEVADLPATPGA
ncbi:ScbA/BarX family gamma-butyrolactone biosynthesis protein [Streptomyces purpureus]|uniref:Adhesin n=1 Tax=Streptomyces purpureus TaxID=1951 RepID=A0A918H182_9ACTN|nr:ScbA/BarX family gamma-butyrolactone biosynthesis protein [Streptomyces purpureus]GGT28643.1 adhesin [Streptomyces purpureus]